MDDRITPDLLIAAYCQGIFPMARSRESRTIDWYSPEMRAILPPDGLRVSRSLRQRVASGVFEIRCDTAFEEVVKGCAEPRRGERQTWINAEICRAYTELAEMGLAHSVEAWRDGRLVGGLYGVHLGGAFFGESMFHRADLGGTDASKVCLVHLVEHLRSRGFCLLDVQTSSEHMARLGVIEIPREAYLTLLADALDQPAAW
jgi:leucyl/phenylalanyl-tRNA--protein transferase